MKIINNLLILLSLLALLVIPSTATALVKSIDLNDFCSDGAVWTKPTGYLAVMSGQFALVKNPATGNPGFGVREQVRSILFYYLFFDWLHDDERVFGKEFEKPHTSFGHVSWDLAGMFTKPIWHGLKDKAPTIMNNPIHVSADNVPVPEPATMLLLGAGLLGIAGLGKKKLLQ